jgi:hypothetical protein
MKPPLTITLDATAVHGAATPTSSPVSQEWIEHANRFTRRSQWGNVVEIRAWHAGGVVAQARRSGDLWRAREATTMDAAVADLQWATWPGRWALPTAHVDRTPTKSDVEKSDVGEKS